MTKPLLTAIQPLILDTMTFPLHGARLIEASAGTGKTFTIAGLYIRLLLGHGSSNAQGETTRHQQPLTVEQILVVTFTEAATAELRARIRDRIHEVRMAFMRGSSDNSAIQPLLQECSSYADAAELLLQAERNMDEAAIYTIHGFCQRMLTQNAFESGSRFDYEFITDEYSLKEQVVADYWRCQFYSLSTNVAREVQAIWSDPTALLKKISNYLSGVPLTLTVAPITENLSTHYQKNIDQIVQLKRLWLNHQGELLDLINQSGVNKRSYSSRNLPNWLSKVNEWADSETNSLYVVEQLSKFSQIELNEKTSPDKEAPQHTLFREIDAFLNHLPKIKDSLLAHAISQCRERLAQVKQQQQQLYFDDLLTRLAAAIDRDLASDNIAENSTTTLCARIRRLYPVAMIDEFQDTDPQQYHIFSHIYLSDPNTGLFMIGDPKQAIYSFRGADIFTYMKARQQVKAHYTLATNWRSSLDMVKAVNQLFSAADRPFIYDEDIPFYPVYAAPNAAQRGWYLKGEKQKALTYWLPNDADQIVTREVYYQEMAAATANQIHAILTASQQQQAYVMDADDSSPRAIQAGHIAVLVRTGREGRIVQQALAQQGIASVYLSNQDSVFDSPIALDLLRLLQAVLSTENERALRASLASSLFNLSLSQLEQLNHDEQYWEQYVNEFKEYRYLWLQNGVMPMLRAVMKQHQIAEKLLQNPSGERYLTDLLHLGELLQQASQEIESGHALLRWLAENITQQNRSTVASQIQRLESERDLVQIITIHKSKGLEYDLVFLPFVCSYRKALEGKYYDFERQEMRLEIRTGSEEEKEALQRADRDRLAEDLRLLYVAVTRAVYGCFIGIAAVKNGRSTKVEDLHLSAIGYLIQNGEELDSSQLEPQLNKLISGAIASESEASPERYIQCCELPVAPTSPLVASEVDIPPPNALSLKTTIDRNWTIISYSGLMQRHFKNQNIEIDDKNDDFIEKLTVEKLSAETLKEPEPDITVDTVTHVDTGTNIDMLNPLMLAAEPLTDTLLTDIPPLSIFDFPRGTKAGTFLHRLFESIEFTQSANSTRNSHIIAQLLAQEGYEACWLDVLKNLVDRVLNLNLMPPYWMNEKMEPLRLSTKTAQQRLIEMDFLLPVEVLSAFHLNRVITHHDTLSSQANKLGFHTVKGMLKGFIDLIFEHQGKYYLLDWKSNYLGNDVNAYQPQALATAMIEHRYDLQYQIYALALHRFLATRLKDYDYQHHFGGVYYLFLRGIEDIEAKESNDNHDSNRLATQPTQSDAFPSGVFFTKPSFSLLDELDQLIQGNTPLSASTDSMELNV